MTTPELISLRDADDPVRHGSKAAQLARLAATGLPVPDGLVLPADTSDAQIPDTLPRVMDWAAGRAPYGLIARSSAPSEDGPTASFAGLLCSEFTPARPAALLEAIRKVRASAGSPRVHHYAITRGIPYDHTTAVIVQLALRPYAAGVLAAELDAGSVQVWQIEALYGLAEPIVNGQQNGELHHSHNPGEPRPAQQTSMLLPASADELRLPPGEWIDLPTPSGQSVPAKIQTSHAGLLHLYPPTALADSPVLTAEMRDRLLQLTITASQALHLDQIDIEWALMPDGEPQLVQARPLTQRVPAPAQPALCAADIWQGIPAAPGRGTGRALQLDPTVSRTNCASAGAVIICHQLGPDASSTLLQRPAAIATTTGGPLSHAAIVARELGMPCVTALPETITKIPDGTQITIDGLTGTLRPATRPSTCPAAERQRTAVTRAAVVTLHPPAVAPDDDRAATLVLHHPDNDQRAALANLMSSAPAAPVPMGLFQPNEQPPLTPLPTGYTDHHLPGLGRIAWPTTAGALPTSLVILDGARAIYQRSLQS